jgi:hypothetical protein
VCKQCVEIDKKIEHYRFMASRITDQPMLDGIKELIERMTASYIRCPARDSRKPADESGSCGLLCAARSAPVNPGATATRTTQGLCQRQRRPHRRR